MSQFQQLIFFCAISYIFISDCTIDKKIEFESTQDLTSTIVDGITVYSNGNVYLSVVDTFLVIVKSEQPFIKIYSTNTHRLLKEFGIEGRGPNELIAPSIMKPITSGLGENSHTINLHDFKRNKIGNFNIINVLAGQETIQINNIPGNISYMPFLHYIDDEYLIGTPIQRGNLLIYDIVNELQYLIPYLPELEFSTPNFSKDVIYRPAVLINKEKNLIAASPLFLGEIDFFNFEGNLLRSSIFESRDIYKEELTAGESAFSNIKQYIVELHSKDDLIFGLNYNTAVKKLRNEIWETKISVFNWNGEPVLEYNLDGRPIRSMAIDEIHNRFYAYDPTEKEHNIVMYSFD